jgi:hypothetical protein
MGVGEGMVVTILILANFSAGEYLEKELYKKQAKKSTMKLGKKIHISWF